VFRAAVDLRAD
jgi:N-formylglutamate amidohydrolase